ncbi:hypothetical protein HK104_004335 [Borealophlyctis nickersoniae]|nr:hypothetical protein HK104_004335 [Borealophlyctis nickersoniae]
MTGFNHPALLIIAAVLLVLLSLSPATASTARELAEEADKSIRHIPLADVEKETAKDGITVLFFGAWWCRFTQRFTPKYLEVQKLVDAEGKEGNYKYLRMAKVECSEKSNKDNLCAKYADGFPTTLVWIDGKPQGEYPDADETKNLLNYIHRQVDSYKPKPEAVPAPTAPAAESPAPATVPASKAAAAAPEAKPEVKANAEVKAAASEASPTPAVRNLNLRRLVMMDIYR